ncbi:histidine phosphatase family protein [Nocardia sp. CA2R105]|uniref:histidine phosphatase family protein n=1 Tax=Nocardia coffeae TaxID=2873381 RepID=UPI001CA66B6C|nr:histidine phosphatase family protein [Nocardia coffeae]MBY8856122.1 histidine phosphatase family protein [Nocardia coffeae]
MNSPTRLTLVTHAITDAVRAARFPLDEPLDVRAVERGGELPEPLRADLVLIGPEVRAAQTAALFGLDGVTEPALADLNSGSWAGASMDAIPGDQLMGWLTDPEFRSHGGESVTDLLARTKTWLAEVAARQRRIVAFTHPGIVRACILLALDAPPISFWRLDIPPSSATTLHFRGGSWTVRGTARPL